MSSVNCFRILVVCTGNVCRSAMVERVLQAHLDESTPGSFEVRSAGTRALVGQGMTEEVAALVRHAGGSAVDFESRQLTGQALTGQDLVLGLTREHRAKVLEIAPKLLRVTFTLREFGRMVRFITNEQNPAIDWSADAYARWKQLIPAVTSVRHQVIGTADDDDVVDPYRKDLAVHRQMSSEIEPALVALSGFQSGRS